MTKITNQSSYETEQLENKLATKGYQAATVTHDAISNKIFIGDGRNFLENEHVLIDVGNYKKAKVLGASGEIDKANKLKIYSNLFLQMYANKKKIIDIREKVAKSVDQIGSRILGAAGPTAVTDYDTIRQAEELLTVIGESHTNEDYQAINIADKVQKDAVKFEYLKRTSARIIAQSNIADNDEANIIKHAYALGKKEIFAYGLAFEVSTRDKIDTKIDVVADFTKDVQDAFLAAKNEDVVTLLNAKIAGGTNQGDWDAMTIAGKYDVSAAQQVQVGEDAVKKYGAPLIAIMNSDAWRLYMQNQQGVYFNGVQGNVQNRSTSEASMKSGTLPGNPGVKYFIDDALTAGGYVLASQKAYMKYFQAMTIRSEYINPRTPGKMATTFWYDYAGFEETLTGAAFAGNTVGA